MYSEILCKNQGKTLVFCRDFCTKRAVFFYSETESFEKTEVDTS